MENEGLIYDDNPDDDDDDTIDVGIRYSSFHT